MKPRWSTHRNRYRELVTPLVWRLPTKHERTLKDTMENHALTIVRWRAGICQANIIVIDVQTMTWAGRSYVQRACALLSHEHLHLAIHQAGEDNSDILDFVQEKEVDLYGSVSADGLTHRDTESNRTLSLRKRKRPQERMNKP